MHRLESDRSLHRPSESLMCTSHPDFVRLFALATVSVGPVNCVSTQSPFFDAWTVNVSILPQLEF